MIPLFGSEGKRAAARFQAVQESRFRPVSALAKPPWEANLPSLPQMVRFGLRHRSISAPQPPGAFRPDRTSVPDFVAFGVSLFVRQPSWPVCTPHAGQALFQTSEGRFTAWCNAGRAWLTA